MRRSGIGSGGGIGNNKVTHRAAGKYEPKPNAMNVKGVSQIGQSLGNHIMERSKVLKNVVQPLHAGRGYSPPIGPSDNVKAVGVGGGRSIYRSGFQGTHGAVNPGRSPERRDILSEFGPDKARR